ncbi:MAG: hypothetical protein V1816_25855 [Pseudomonadota bacterium]
MKNPMAAKCSLIVGRRRVFGPNYLGRFTEMRYPRGSCGKIKWIICWLLFLLTAACGAGTEDFPATVMPIDVPSDKEKTMAEMRDFMVVGYFNPPLDHPGDIRIELFVGEQTMGTPIRVIESRVDPASGVTPDSAFETNYGPDGNNWGLTKVPDLIKEPGGLDNPNNKVVVTNDYYAGVILGGVTRNYRTTYADEAGRPYRDLTAGVYTIRVKGLSGGLAHAVGAKTIRFDRTHALFGRFRPTEHFLMMQALGLANGLRVYIDPFPGYFSYNNTSFEIRNRWMPNNGIESVNHLPGTLVDNPGTAVSDFIIYNISDSCATRRVELGAVTAYNLVDSPRVTYHRYDVGEPSIQYVDRAGVSQFLGGAIVSIVPGDRLVLPRAEIKTLDGSNDENKYWISDATPRELDTDLSDGLDVGAGDEFSVFGVLAPIPSEVEPGVSTAEYLIRNRISKIQYTITDPDGNPAVAAVKDVNLGRAYDAANPANFSYSLYEFKHEFSLAGAAGPYLVTMVGLDDQTGAPVEGAEETFQVTLH